MIVGISLAALALPIASVILTLQVLTKGSSEQAPEPPDSGASGALENVLEGIADEQLAPGELDSGASRAELLAFDVNEERERVEGLLKSAGGVAVLTSESESEIRLLARVPAEQLSEFLAACFGDGPRPAVGDLFEIVIKKMKTP